MTYGFQELARLKREKQNKQVKRKSTRTFHKQQFKRCFYLHDIYLELTNNILIIEFDVREITKNGNFSCIFCSESSIACFTCVGFCFFFHTKDLSMLFCFFGNFAHIAALQCSSSVGTRNLIHLFIFRNKCQGFRFSSNASNRTVQFLYLTLLLCSQHSSFHSYNWCY